MKRLLFTVSVALISVMNCQAQLVLKNVEDFSVGSNSRYLKIKDANNLLPGPSGDNVTWDFSQLSISGTDTAFQEIVNAKESKYSSTFPNADIAEKNNDGSWVFQQKNKDNNIVWGVVSEQGLEMANTTPYTFIKRPFKYKDSIGGVAERKYSLQGQPVNGTNTYYTIADGWGTLKLGNKVYKNVLRIKFAQVFEDRSPSSVTKITIVSYGWFDKDHRSSLLKMNHVKIENKWYNKEDSEVMALINEYIAQ